MTREPERYFVNDLPDWEGGPVHLDVAQDQEWQRYIVDRANGCYDHLPANDRNADGGLYVGVSGLAYMFYRLAKCGDFQKEKGVFLAKAKEIIEFCEKYTEKERARIRNKSEESGFILGNAGTYALAAAIHHVSGDKERSERWAAKYKDCADICTPINFVKFGGDEFLVGRCGYLAGALWLNKQLCRAAVPLEKMYTVCDSIVESGRKYSKCHKSPSPLMYSYYNTEYLGAGHGLSSILQVVMSVDGYLEMHPDIEEEVKQSVDYLLSLQTPDGNFPCDMEEAKCDSANNGSRSLVHWCHGAPGVIYLMAKAYLQWNDDKYLESCKRAADLIWQKGLLKKGPGLCHGVAGNGYALLAMYRLTREDKYLHRASEFARFLVTPRFQPVAFRPDNPYSLYEGWAGTLLYLSDLLHPTDASFPFMDIFTGDTTL